MVGLVVVDRSSQLGSAGWDAASPAPGKRGKGGMTSEGQVSFDHQLHAIKQLLKLFARRLSECASRLWALSKPAERVILA